MIEFSTIVTLCKGKVLQLARDERIEFLLTDSRKAFASNRGLFFAINGVRNDGHEYLQELYDKGIRQFVVEKEVDLGKLPNANVLLVESSIECLQALAKHHRMQFDIPIVGITGSNGKTIVKEWLYELLSADYDCIKNPGSYNSQIGVPLSVWQLDKNHNLGIFEAGISKPNEMARLQEIIQPTIGIITNIGTAHSEGFAFDEDKVSEKVKLFATSNSVVYCSDYDSIREALSSQRSEDQALLGWGYRDGSKILLKAKTEFEIAFFGAFGNHSFTYPFSDSASIENLTHCIVTLLHLNFEPEEIQERINRIRPVEMRLEVKQGINQCLLVDDSYNNDLAGFQIGLDFMEGLGKMNRTVILSDFQQSGLGQEEIANRVISMLREKGVTKFYGIGLGFAQTKDLFKGQSDLISHFYLTTDDFISQVDLPSFRDEVILVKGGRVFRFEKIVNRLQRRIHRTVMSIDLERMINNLNFFKSLLDPEVKLMVMVKALAYGSGSNEIASLLQYHKVDYLGVAYTDEGVDLRKNNVRIPIMVMNPVEDGFGSLVEFDLEPEVYSLSLLKSLIQFLDGREMGIHLKIDTGMNRLGFVKDEVGEIIKMLGRSRNLKVLSIFSHLAGSDDPSHDEFTKKQYDLFTESALKIEQALSIRPLRHILNSSGILRFPNLQLDMVRLGIGLYGIDPSGQMQSKLSPAVALKSVISQIKVVESGETIGYGRMGVAKDRMKIATIAIGYADGFSRAFSQGNGIVVVRGQEVPVVGNVCMDMTMVDVTLVEDAEEGDEVIIFGDALPIESVAKRINTIPYEILANTGERVKRVFLSGGL